MSARRHKRRKGRKQQVRRWQPMQRGLLGDKLAEAIRSEGLDPTDYEAWGNDLYGATVHELDSGMLHISVSRRDRHALRDWRHLQQIKNEIAGAEREALEIYPAESRLVDEANEYHLWVMPEDEELPVGFPARSVSSDEQLQAYNRSRERGEHVGRQRPWQPGLTTGEGRNAV